MVLSGSLRSGIKGSQKQTVWKESLLQSMALLWTTDLQFQYLIMQYNYIKVKVIKLKYVFIL